MKHKWMARQTFYLILLLALIISVPFSTIGAKIAVLVNLLSCESVEMLNWQLAVITRSMRTNSCFTTNCRRLQFFGIKA